MLRPNNHYLRVMEYSVVSLTPIISRLILDCSSLEVP